MKKRLVALFAMLAMLFTATVAVFPANALFEDSEWLATKESGAPEDYAYSFAFVGDTQVLSMLDAGTVPEEYDATTNKANIVYPAGDTKGDTKYMDTLYQWILDNQPSKKIQYVFGLGDITENIVCKTGGDTGNGNYSDNDIEVNDKEWEIAYAAISKLNGVIPYSVARGNHDTGSGFNKHFNNDTYLSQFAGNYDKAANTYRELVVGDQKYLIMTLDYAPYDKYYTNEYGDTRGNEVLLWADGILAQEKFANHKAIIITHGFFDSKGDFIEEKDRYHNTDAQYAWENYFSKHENVHMIVAGHVGVNVPVITTKTGINGNEVKMVLIDPQNNDIGSKSTPVDNGDGTTTTTINVNPTGAVTMFYFSADGEIVYVEDVQTIKAAKGVSPYIKRLDARLDALTNLDEYGYTYYSVSDPSIAASPVIDGIVSNDEYRACYSAATMGTSTISERFAYDAKNLYFAFSYKLPAAQPGTLTFSFSGDDSHDPIKENAVLTYTVSSGEYAVTGLDKSKVSAKAKVEGDILTFEMAIDIDAVQSAFEFARHTISYTLEASTGEKRSVILSDELKNALDNDYGTLTEIPQFVTFDYDSKTAFEALGHKQIYLGDTAKTITFDGVVNKSEYLYMNTVAKNDTTNLEAAISVDIEEYLSYDDTYIYAAMVLKNDTLSDSNSLTFNLHNLSDDSYSSHERIAFIVFFDSNGTITKKESAGRKAASFSATMHASTMKDENGNEDTAKWDAKVTYNAETKTTTIEYKFNRSAVAEMIHEDTLECFGFSSVVKGKFRYWSYRYNSDRKTTVTSYTSQWEGRTATDNQFFPFYVHLSSHTEGMIATYDAACVRLSDKSGLRFVTEINKDFLNDIVTKYGKENVKVGTLIAPTDTLVGVDFTIYALEQLHKNTGKVTYATIEATIDSPFKTCGNKNIYAGSIVNIKLGNIHRAFSAVGYISYTENGVTTYIYSDTIASRCVSDVAQAALDDLSTVQDNNYQYAVEDMDGYYSKYSTEDRKILVSLLSSTVKDPFGSDIFAAN